ncbi:hypothetical protein [Polaribacter sp.]|uniref:hypothetical protein n=1 Tax=Polaribacter sp. TaxID=1920175 RepID=UPI0025EAE616|nr:hypothetical protein [Polaribacter sp.]
MKKKLVLVIIILLFNSGFSQELKKENYEVVKLFIEKIKKNNIKELGLQIRYPLRREYPVSNIRNKEEFEKRYNEVFDDSLKTKIISSNINTDWSTVGWRKIMFNNGILWLDYDGRLLSINYESNLERDRRFKIIEQDKNLIHESLKDFNEPIHYIKTKKTKIRIDRMHNGKYRYSSWSINSKISEKPDITIKNGVWSPEGSGGNQRYKFTNGNYQYYCFINILGAEDSSSAELIIHKNEKEILKELGQIIRK